MTPDQERRLAAAMAPPLAWWHYMPNTWAVIDPIGMRNAGDIRAIVEGASPGTHCLIVEVEGTTWSMRGPWEYGEWFRKFWETA
jgi:hypothetical protein